MGFESSHVVVKSDFSLTNTMKTSDIPIFFHMHSPTASRLIESYLRIYCKGYVTGDVFPIIQNMERFTKNATTPDNRTISWKKKITKFIYVIVHNDLSILFGILATELKLPR